MSERAFYFQLPPRSSLVFLLTSPLAAVNNVDARVFLLRLATALVTLADILLVYELSRRRFGERAAFLGTITFLLSFVVLRYGSRYTLEPWGVLFILLALYTLEERPLLSALSAGLAFAARETWLTTYPFMVFYVWRRRRGDFRRFVAVSLLPVAFNLTAIYIISLHRSPLGYNLRALIHCGFPEILSMAWTSWIQFVVAFPIQLAGFVFAVYVMENRDEPLLIVLPSVLTLNFVSGFLLNGPFERYTFGPLALMSIYSGYGLIKLYDAVSRKAPIVGKMSLERWVALFLIFQLLAFNAAVVKLSSIGANGIQDYGYWHDREVFSVLEGYGSLEDSFGGTPHPALLGFEDWTWADRNITGVLNISPDWLVTFRSWVSVDRGALTSGAIEMWTFGPYVVIHARQEGAIKEYVIPVDPSSWRRW
nr:glycosyltransferase family 39 protein [Thermococcus sp. MV11]